MTAKQEGQVAGPVLRSIFLPPVHLPALVTFKAYHAMLSLSNTPNYTHL